MQPTPIGYAFDSLTDGHDSVRGHTFMLLSDLNNQWVSLRLETANPAPVEPHGSGCPGSLGQSQLRLLHSWTRAWLGRALEVELTNLPQSLGIVTAGWSDQHYGTTALPAPLDGYGMPGCTARVAPESVWFVGGTANRATLSLPVPIVPSLVGVTFFQQGYAFDPGFNPLGLTVTNSLRVTVGNL